LTEWRDVAERYPAPSLVVICIGGRMPPKAELAQEVALAADTGGSAPVVIFSDGEDVGQILEALDAGARGVIPTSLSLEVANQALRLVKAGGTFVPAHALSAPRDVTEGAGLKRGGNGIFTERQAAVVEKVVQGKANKVIAYELAMCESTVKVHVRTIMKKLRATNRTQVAYIYQSMKAA
jgi:DNA-binding NarL/FixJ family response regulator